MIAGWRSQLDLFRKSSIRKEKRPTVKGKRQSVDLNVVAAVIKSFKVRKCYVKVDTGNMQLNGILYPGFYLLSKATARTFEINFMNTNEIVLEIENNIARIIKVFIFHSFTNKNK